MGDDAQNSPTSADRALGPLPAGTILDERYELRRQVGLEGALELHLAEDLALGMRRVLVVVLRAAAEPTRRSAEESSDEVPSGSQGASLRASARRAWLEATDPALASLADLIELPYALVAVFPVPDGAERLVDAPGLSREQRASVLVRAAAAISPPGNVGARSSVTRRDSLWAARSHGEVRPWIIPLPEVALADRPSVVEGQSTGDDDGEDGDEPSTAVRATDTEPPRSEAGESGEPAQDGVRGVDVDEAERVGAHHLAEWERLAREVCVQLYGCAPDDPPELLLDALPAELREFIDAALRGEQPADGWSAARLALLLGVDGSAARVPVQPIDTSNAGATSTARYEAALRIPRQRVAWATVIAFFALGLAAGFFYGLFSSAQARTSGLGPASAPSRPTLRSADTASRSPVRTPSPDEVIAAPSLGTFYASAEWRVDGPHPRGQPVVTPPWNGQRFLAPSLPWRHDGFVRFIDRPADPGIERVEQYGAGGHLEGYHEISYDDDGRMVRRVAFDRTGTRERTLTYDHSRAVIRAFELDGRPSEPGCASLAFGTDAVGRFTSRSCMDDRGILAVHEHGHATRRVAYGERTQTTTFQDAQGRSVPGPSGCAKVHDIVDDFGVVVSRAFSDEHGAPCVDSELGAERWRLRYSATQTTQSLLRASGEPMVGHAGWHRRVQAYNTRGDLVLERTFDDAGAPVAAAPYEAYAVEWERRDDGHATAIVFRGPTGAELRGSHDVSRYEFERDHQGFVTSQCAFLPGGVPATSELLGGAHCARFDRDHAGRVVVTRYTGASGQAVAAGSSQTAAVGVVRDGRGRIVEVWYAGEDGQLVDAWWGTPRVAYEYDEAGHRTGAAFLNADGARVDARNGIAKYVDRHDGFGRWIHRCFFDSRGAPVRLTSGLATGAHCIGRDFDARGFPAMLTYEAPDGRPTTARFGGMAAAHVVNEWRADGTLAAQRYADPSGELLPTRHDCTLKSAARCLDVDGWSWHVAGR